MTIELDKSEHSKRIILGCNLAVAFLITAGFSPKEGQEIFATAEKAMKIAYSDNNLSEDEKTEQLIEFINNYEG